MYRIRTGLCLRVRGKWIEGYIIKCAKKISKTGKEFSDDEFNDNEVKLLEEISRRFLYCTAKELIDFTHRSDSIWYRTALKNGVLDLLESGQMKTTNIEIPLREVIEDEEEKLARYRNHKEFTHFTSRMAVFLNQNTFLFSKLLAITLFLPVFLQV